MKRILVVGLLLVLAVPIIYAALWANDVHRYLTPDRARKAGAL